MMREEADTHLVLYLIGLQVVHADHLVPAIDWTSARSLQIAGHHAEKYSL
jgi:hypothetical protein